MLSTQVNLLKGLSVMTLQVCAQYNKQAQKKKVLSSSDCPAAKRLSLNYSSVKTKLKNKVNSKNHRCVSATTDPVPDKPAGGGSGESSADIVSVRDLN